MDGLDGRHSDPPMPLRIAVRSACVAVFMSSMSAALPGQGAAAPRDSAVAVRLKDGSLLVGRLELNAGDSVRIATGAGRMTVARSAITELKVIDASEIHGGTYWPPDPHDTRLFFGPTGRTLAKGTGYFSDQYLFLMNFAVGVTDRFMIGAGMSLIPSGNFFENNVYYVTPKFALVRGESFNVAVGALVGFAPRSSDRASGSAGIYYLAATNGRPDASVTYGVGYAFFDNRVSGDATLMLGGNVRVARRVSLMTENYIFTGPGGGYWAPMYGVRFIGDRLSTDLGLVNFVGRGTTPVTPGVPWVGFALKF